MCKNMFRKIKYKDIYRKSFFIPLELGGGIINVNHNVVINSIKENKVLVTKRIFKNGNKCGFRKSKAIIIKLHDFLTNQHLKDSFVPNEIIW